MADSASTSSSSLGLGDLLALLGGANPLAGISKSIAQFQHGVTQLIESVERFNDTMDQLNQVAHRVNGLLDTVEQLSGPLEMVAPAIAKLPTDLAAISNVVNDLGRFLQPLGLRPLAALRSSVGRQPAPPVAPAPAPAPKKPAAKKPAAKKAAAKKAPGKKGAATRR